ncbi:hypothetical protein Tco_0360237 [Tanacetum coccineum]
MLPSEPFKVDRLAAHEIFVATLSSTGSSLGPGALKNMADASEVDVLLEGNSINMHRNSEKKNDITIDKEKVLWVELKRLFEPDDDDTLWKLQRYMHDPLKWRLYDTCGVHHVSTERGHDIFMLVEKDYPLTRALMTVMLVNKLQVDESSEMANELLRKIFYQVERSRT